jgi:hypothetical protein
LKEFFLWIFFLPFEQHNTVDDENESHFLNMTQQLPIGTYQGDTKGGLAHGFGTIVFPNGNRYEGNWIEGKRTGYGIYYYSNGSKYEGEVVDGHLQGRGILTFANGNHYEGLFHSWK